MASNLNVTELDFDQIKQNLKNFLKSQDQFTDYDFEGSGLSVLLDVLAYNTHYNAMAAHFALNEAFLDSAQIRGNVVTRARLLGYVPRSVLSPRARVKFVLTAPTAPSSLTLTRGTKLTTDINGEEHTFIVLNNINADKDVNNKFTFDQVEIAQGTYRTLLGSETFPRGETTGISPFKSGKWQF